MIHFRFNISHPVGMNKIKSGAISPPFPPLCESIVQIVRKTFTFEISAPLPNFVMEFLCPHLSPPNRSFHRQETTTVGL